MFALNGMNFLDVIKTLLDNLKAEQSVFRSRIEEIQMNLTSPDLTSSEDNQCKQKQIFKNTYCLLSCRLLLKSNSNSFRSRILPLESDGFHWIFKKLCR